MALFEDVTDPPTIFDKDSILNEPALLYIERYTLHDTSHDTSYIMGDESDHNTKE